MQQKNHQIWFFQTLRAFVFFAASLIVMTGIRLFFFYYYKTDQTLAEEWPALLLGMRLDARWFAILLLPAWVVWLLGLWKTRFLRWAKGLATAALALFVLTDVINIGFYGFYTTPISAVIFGLAQDDTKAILVTLWQDWPVITYTLCWVILTMIPCFAFHFGKNRGTCDVSGRRILATVIVLTAVLGILCRGSFGTFPLRQQDLVVGTDDFINASVQNGPAALYEANKSRKMLELKGGINAGLKGFGYVGPEAAEEELFQVRGLIPAAVKPSVQPHVVVAVMESMGRTEFEADSPMNHMLGRLRPELKDAVVFKNGICSGSGTFPSLEGILFDTPLTPLTQSRYGVKSFPFSQAWDFKRAGYKTVFLTSGTEKWRNIDENFPRQGFDRIIGAAAVKAKFPQAEFGTWGVGDAWTFRYAEELLEQADQSGEKLFLVILSATNHPPYRVPDGAMTETVNPNELPAYVLNDRKAEETRAMMQTYQYAASALGDFVHTAREKGLLSKTVMAVTGDHNARFKFESSGIWHYTQGVPLIFWLPQDSQSPADVDRWVSHRDIFPTLKALALGKTPVSYQGRNLFSKETFDAAHTFFGLGKEGFAIGKAGAVSVDGAQFRCFVWQGERLTPAAGCNDALTAMGKAARAQRALTDYAVRTGVLQGVSYPENSVVDQQR